MPHQFKSQKCVFCAIITGEESSVTVYRTDLFIAFLDKRPLFPGHVLLLPVQHYQTLTDIPKETLGPLFETAQMLCCAVEQAMNADGTFVAINNRVSQSIPHLHIHIVPRKKGDGLRGFFWPRSRYHDTMEMSQIAHRIVTHITMIAKKNPFK